MSCRAGESWSAPVFLQLAKGSWGFQAGAEQVDVLMLVMNESGVQKLLRNNVTLGADASVAAGPVGRQANASTDATLTAEILAYSRATGLFAGLNLSGGVLRSDEDANKDVYGANATPSTILATRSISAPTEATAFLQGLESGADKTAAAAASAAQGAGAGSAGAATPSTSGPTPAPAATEAAQTPTPSNDVPRTTDSDLRAAIVAMQQIVDRMLTDQNGGAPVGTGGDAAAGSTTSSSSQMVSVSRERLEQLRDQLDALIESLNARGQ
jgi:lipid-binding SYLF domain-containing protein